MADAEKVQKAMAKKKINIQRSAGGHMWHLVPEGERRALCGYAPGDRITTAMGRRRARWAERTEYTAKEDDSVDRICTKCLAMLIRASSKSTKI